jgi:FG-GAP-like repeat
MSNKNKRNRNAMPGSNEARAALPVNQPDLIELKHNSSGYTNDSDIPTNRMNQSKIKNGWTYLKSHTLMIAIICFLALGTLGAGLKYLEEDARRQMASGGSLRVSKGAEDAEESTFLNKLNPFLPAALPVPTPQLSKELIYAGGSGRLLAVEDANASPTPPADLAIWRPSSGVWYVLGGSGSQQTVQQWGINGDTTAQGDYDGDGKTDFCIFRPSANTWWILKSSDGNYYSVTFGAAGDKTAQADYDGDGKTDIAVFRPSTGTWYINQSSNGTSVQGQFGLSTDTPIPKDFDGDGRADLAVWRSSNSTFYSQNSSNNQLQTANFIQSSTVPVPADYDGDGRADYAIRTGADWIIKQSSTNQTQIINWQTASDTEVPNDYDGDGKVDIAVWRNTNGNWSIRQSSKVGQAGELRQVQWGMTGDIPVPAFYRR